MPAPTRAFLLGQLAVATAAEGDHHQALTNLRAAEAQLERATSTRTPVGSYNSASLFHQLAKVHIHSGERRAAITALGHSLRNRPAGDRRARAITRAKLAELYLDAGNLEQACSTWRQFLDDYQHLRCGRADTALATLRARIRPYTNHPHARALHLSASRLNHPVD